MTAAGGPKALIVEDRPFVALVISDVLREMGFDGLFAYDSAEALQILAGPSPIRLAIVACELAGHAQGLELSRRIASEHPQVQIVVTTAGEDVPAADALPPGARLLRKPFASGELRALVGGLSLLQDA